jgi:uncharacterized protein YciI
MKIQLILIPLLLSSALVAGQSITPEYIQEKVSKGRAYTIVFLKAGKKQHSSDPKQAEQKQMEHLIYLFKLKEQEKLPLFGPFTKSGDLRGICIFNSDNAEEVKKLLDEEPLVKEGLLTYEIHPWFGIPGDKLPER